MTSVISSIVRKFIAEHPEELVNGKLKVCIGGGAGFIGSHIAKQLRSDVRITLCAPLYLSRSFFTHSVNPLLLFTLLAFCLFSFSKFY
jgi:hypothetical protein